MQTQAPGYKPSKNNAPGYKKGVRGNVKTGNKKGNMNKMVRKTSPYSKNRTGVRTTKIGKGYKSMALDSSIKNQQSLSNNSPGFNFPLGPPNSSF